MRCRVCSNGARLPHARRMDEGGRKYGSRSPALCQHRNVRRRPRRCRILMRRRTIVAATARPIMGLDLPGRGRDREEESVPAPAGFRYDARGSRRSRPTAWIPPCTSRPLTTATAITQASSFPRFLHPRPTTYLALPQPHVARRPHGRPSSPSIGTTQPRSRRRGSPGAGGACARASAGRRRGARRSRKEVDRLTRPHNHGAREGCLAHRRRPAAPTRLAAAHLLELVHEVEPPLHRAHLDSVKWDDFRVRPDPLRGASTGLA